MDAVVDLLGIGPLLERRPAKLSGGEKQRVAIGRALLASPRLLLMDEPLASLDEARKAEILPYIERLRDETKIPIVYVSHSVAEVARLASDVVMLAQGKVVACGPTEAIMQRLDLLPAEERGEGGAVLDTKVLRHDEAFGMTVLGSAAGEIRVPRLAIAAGAPVRIRIRARDVMIATEQPHGPQRAQHPARHDRRDQPGRGAGGRGRHRLQRRNRAGPHHRTVAAGAEASAWRQGFRGGQDGELRPGEHRRRPARRGGWMTDGAMSFWNSGFAEELLDGSDVTAEEQKCRR